MGVRWVCVLMAVGVRTGRGVLWLRRRCGRARRRSEGMEDGVGGCGWLDYGLAQLGEHGRFSVYGVGWSYWALGYNMGITMCKIANLLYRIQKRSQDLLFADAMGYYYNL